MFLCPNNFLLGNRLLPALFMDKHPLPKIGIYPSIRHLGNTKGRLYSFSKSVGKEATNIKVFISSLQLLVQ